MRVFLVLLFLTLVVNSVPAFAAPQTTTTLESTPLSAEDDPVLGSINPSTLPPRPTFLLNVSAGYEGGNYLERDEYLQGLFVAFRYVPLTNDVPVWDYEVEINKENMVGLSVGRRWYCCPGDAYMPYARASANLFLHGSDELAGIAEIRRWRLRGALGVGENFTAEFGVGIAVTGPDIFGHIGYNIPF